MERTQLFELMGSSSFYGMKAAFACRKAILPVRHLGRFEQRYCESNLTKAAALIGRDTCRTGATSKTAVTGAFVAIA
jgi:hypothetical protein